MAQAAGGPLGDQASGESIAQAAPDLASFFARQRADPGLAGAKGDFLSIFQSSYWRWFRESAKLQK
jgi:hypothetical protein